MIKRYPINANTSAYLRISRYTTQHDLILCAGRIITRVQRLRYHNDIRRIMIVFLWVLWFQQLSQIKYCFLTLVGETIYLRTVAQALRERGVPFRWLRLRQYLPYYVVGTRALPFLGCLPQDLSSEPFSFLPLSPEELRALSAHTKL